jgi:hypothetical protein
MSDSVQNQIERSKETDKSEAQSTNTVRISLELPVSATLSRYVRALETARDEQVDLSAKQVMAVLAALASRGLVVTLAKSIQGSRGT